MFAKQESQETEIGTPPDPSKLKPNWWSYFQVDPERLSVRIQKTVDLLNNLSQELSEDQRRVGMALVAQITTNFQNYQELLKAQKELPPIEQKNFEGTYTFEQFLSLGKAITDENRKLSSLKLKVKLDQSNMRSDSSHLDTITADYLPLSSSNPQKFIKGLEIIATKLTLELDTLKLKNQSAQVTRKEEEIAKLDEEVAYARNNIDNTGIQFSRLEQQVAQAELRYYRSQEDLLKAQIAQIDRQFDSLHSQSIFNFLLARSLRKVEWVQYRIEYLLAQILARPGREDVKKIYKVIASLKEEQAITEKELPDWRKGADFSHKKALASGDQKEIQLSQQALSQVYSIESALAFNDFLFIQTDAFIRAHYRTLKDRLIEFREMVKRGYKKYGQWGNKSLFKLGEAPITFFGLLKLVFIIFVAYILAKFTRKLVEYWGGKQKKIRKAGVYTLSRLIYYVIIFWGVIAGISSVGVDFTTFAVIAGALSVGIGFGLQSIVNNFVAGIIVLFEKRLRVKDIIQLETGELGSVMEINVRTTLIKTFDNLEVLVPNSEFVSKKFVNWTLSDKTRRVSVPFSVAYGTDKELVKEVVISAAKEVPTTCQDKEPQVWLRRLGDNGLELELIVWVNEYVQGVVPMATIPRYMWELETALQNHHIKIPYPVRDVQLTQV